MPSCGCGPIAPTSCGASSLKTSGRHGDAENLPGVVRWVLSNLLLNARTRPDFIAYRFEDRKSLSLRLCRGLYGAQEFSWTIRSKETMDAAERDGALVIFECFDPRG